jgi:hypothetical protein
LIANTNQETSALLSRGARLAPNSLKTLFERHTFSVLFIQDVALSDTAHTDDLPI